MSPMLTLMRNTLRTLVEANKFDRVLNQVHIVSASKGRLVAEMPVTDQSVNITDRLHGGMTATLVDQLSSMALTTALIDTDQPKTDLNLTFARTNSVSIDIRISYMNGIKKGDTLVIEANTLKTGKTLAFLSVDMYNKDSRQLVATGSHTKFLLNNNN